MTPGRNGRIEDGRRSVEAVCLKLLEGGFTIDSIELASLARRYTGNPVNAPDIRVWRKGFPEPGYRVIEVKTSSYPFTSVEDFPFDPVIVNRVDTWDRKRIKPFATVVVDGTARSMFVIPTGTATFVKGSRHDSRTETDREYYFVVKEELVPIEWLIAALPMV